MYCEKISDPRAWQRIRGSMADAPLGSGCDENRRIGSPFLTPRRVRLVPGTVTNYNTPHPGADPSGLTHDRNTMKILVLDVGGTNVKIRHSNSEETVRFPSGKSLTPRKFLARVRQLTQDWKYDVVSIGIPTPISNSKPAIEPKNLGKGWKNFDFRKSFQQPVKVINDAALQALGSYHGGRMLFLGLGTGLGSSLLVEHMVVPLELGQMSRTKQKTWEDVVCDDALETVGVSQWQKDVLAMLDVFRRAFLPDYIVLGGGNAKKLTKLPRGVERGDNRNALAGGIRLWDRATEISEKGVDVWRVY
jgi:hypothetical protein